MKKPLDELALIKKHYGEDMMRFCRFHFATMLEEPMFLYQVLTSSFAPNKHLFEDIAQEQKKDLFKEYILSFLEEEETQKTDLSVEELLSSVGYDIFECHNHDEVLRFREYYYDREKLCTFRDPNRIEKYYIFFLRRKDIDQIKREDFPNPFREDLYGRSLLCVQFYKGNYQFVSIKSRYNHTVLNPDSTYSNNLDKIVPGLTDAFCSQYGFRIEKTSGLGFELKNYIDVNYKYYKYNYEINNIYYCPDNLIIDNGKIVETYRDKSRYLFMDYFILDRHEKRLFSYDESLEKDSFLDFFRTIDGESLIQKTDVINEENGKKVIISCSLGDVEIHLDSLGRMISYSNPYLLECGHDFLRENETLETLEIPNLIRCGDCFLVGNKNLRALSLEKLESVGSGFLTYNIHLADISVPKLRECGSMFLSSNKSLKKAIFPSLESCGDSFLANNLKIRLISFPVLRECGSKFMRLNNEVKTLDMPNLVKANREFLLNACKLKRVSLPKLEECGDQFLLTAAVQNVSFPHLVRCGSEFFNCNMILSSIFLPKLVECGSFFLNFNESLEELICPSLERVGDSFLYHNDTIRSLQLPKIKSIGRGFLSHNQCLTELVISPDVDEEQEVQRLRNVTKKNRDEKGKVYEYKRG